jgi:uncharacterized membrane protein
MTFASVAVCGVIGSVADSLLGGSLQAKYKDKDGLTERKPNKNTKPVKGLAVINNDAVNFLSITLGGVLCLIVLMFVGI